MKLLICNNCDSVFNLTYKTKTCECGNVSGRYLDELNAEYSGKHAYPIGFDNYSFGIALGHQPKSGLGRRFDAFVIPRECETFVKVKSKEGIEC